MGLRSIVLLGALAITLSSGACGGGGGGGAPGGGVGAIPTGSVSGRIDYFAPSGIVVEAEPNDTLGQALAAGVLSSGRTVTLIGRVDASTDPFDGYRIKVVSRCTLTIVTTFSTSSTPAPSLTLEAYDPTSLQVVGSSSLAASPATTTVVAKGVLHLVLHASAGSSNYQAVVSAAPVPPPLIEAEPNDAPPQGQFVGELVPSDLLQVAGAASSASDAADGFLLSCPASESIQFTLASPPFQDFDLVFLDATASLTAPTVFAAYETRSVLPETGTLPVPGGRLLRVEVRAFSGQGSYTLTLQGKATTSTAATLARSGPSAAARVPADERPEARPSDAPVLVPVVAPVEAEGDRAPRRVNEPAYGRVPAPLCPGEALVRFHEGRREQGLADLEARGGRVAVDSPSGHCVVRFDVPAGLSSEDAARLTQSRVEAMAGSTAIDLASPNYVYEPMAVPVPDDTLYNLQWNLAQIHAPEAWETQSDAPSIIVAIVDTGSTNHPDLAGHFVGGYDFLSADAGLDGDGPDPDPTEINNVVNRPVRHGTACAGIVSAVTNNAEGVAGVSWNTKIMPVRCFGDLGGNTATIVEGLRFAAGLPNVSGTVPPQRAHVISMSFGATYFDAVLEQGIRAVRDTGVVLVAGAGNTGGSGPVYPAAWDGVISVGATGPQRNRAPYSSFGPSLDLVAPGGIMGVDSNGDGHPDGVPVLAFDIDRNEFTYDFAQGTSFAAPHVAAVAALLLQIDPTLTAAQIESVLESTADDLGSPGRDDFYGHGLVNAATAVAVVARTLRPPTLLVQPTSVFFGPTTTQLSVSLSALGSGFLDVFPPAVETESGGNWLSASLSGTGSATITARSLDLSVSRVGLPIGNYFGSATVASAGGTTKVTVVMSVGLLQPPVPDVFVRVSAISADTGLEVQHVSVNPATSLDFRFVALPRGDYFFRATTDFDGDGVPCEEGDLCGGYPVDSEPTRVTVIAGLETTHVDFAVSPSAELSK